MDKISKICCKNLKYFRTGKVIKIVDFKTNTFFVT